jgi:enoyl-CoA hydratase/carnithine racemase
MHLALACDVVVMADTAKLVPAFVRRGIAPDVRSRPARATWAQESVMIMENAQEGVRALLERRDPGFRGW